MWGGCQLGSGRTLTFCAGVNHKRGHGYTRVNALQQGLIRPFLVASSGDKVKFSHFSFSQLSGLGSVFHHILLRSLLCKVLRYLPAVTRRNLLAISSIFFQGQLHQHFFQVFRILVGLILSQTDPS